MFLETVDLSTFHDHTPLRISSNMGLPSAVDAPSTNSVGDTEHYTRETVYCDRSELLRPINPVPTHNRTASESGQPTSPDSQPASSSARDTPTGSAVLRDFRSQFYAGNSKYTQNESLVSQELLPDTPSRSVHVHRNRVVGRALRLLSSRRPASLLRLTGEITKKRSCPIPILAPQQLPSADQVELFFTPLEQSRAKRSTECQHRWNFNFSKDSPKASGVWQWEKVSPASALALDVGKQSIN